MKKKLACHLISLFVFFFVSLFPLSKNYAQIYVGNEGGNSIPSYSSNVTENVLPLTNIQSPVNALNYV